jgi:hypothetical protein
LDRENPDPAPPIELGLNAVIVAVTHEEPRVLAVRPGEGETLEALPFGPLDAARDRTLELALRGWVREQAGIEVGYVEQLYTFGDRHRDPRERLGGPRMISVGYLSLVREDKLAQPVGARWLDWYNFLPWEDWREGRPKALHENLDRELAAWAAAAGDEAAAARRRERIDIAFGLGGAPWDEYRVLDRYELLYEASLVDEAWRDRGEAPPPSFAAPGRAATGRAMVFDHRRILATAIGRLRGKIKYRPVVFELLPETFTLFQLQTTVEALSGKRVHKQNFRRLVEKAGLVEGTGQLSTGAAGRPAELFRFRREVLRERPKPGVGQRG